MQINTFYVSSVNYTTRFVQGYRYLDRCGETIIQLEDKLGEDWLPGELSPKSGTLTNEPNEATVKFNSDLVSISQETPSSIEYFIDIACRSSEIICDRLEVAKIITPVLQVVLQREVNDEEHGDEELLKMGLVNAEPKLQQIIGPPSSLAFTYVSHDDVEYDDRLVSERTRLRARSIRQYKRRGFDERLLKRAKLLPKRQQDAFLALRNLQRLSPSVPEFALEIDLEVSLESEFNTRSIGTEELLQYFWRSCKKKLKELTS